MNGIEIGSPAAPTPEEAMIEADLSLVDIYVSPQVRKKIIHAEILELAISILENGLLSRIIVRPTALGFEVIAGECRYRACRILYACGLRQTIGAQIVAADDRRKAILQVSENAKRNDVDPGDEADYMQNVLIDEHGMTIAEISKLFGRTPQTIRNYLAVTRLHPDIRRELDRDAINFTSASIIGSLESHGKQLRALSVMRRRGLKTAALRAFVAELRQENNLFALEAVETPRQATARRISKPPVPIRPRNRLACIPCWNVTRNF